MELEGPNLKEKGLVVTDLNTNPKLVVQEYSFTGMAPILLHPKKPPWQITNMCFKGGIIKSRIQTVLRLKSCAITEAWKGKHDHEQICGNLFLHELFIGIFWRTQINKISFSFLIGRLQIFLTRF